MPEKKTITIQAMNKEELKKEGMVERRAHIISIGLEQREDGQESRRISGYAAVFDEKAKIGSWYEEHIARGAFDECDFTKCVLNFNHDNNNLLARTSSGTLELKVDERGLYFSAELPNTSVANDVLELIRRGDIAGCSFAFVVRESSWEWLSDEDPAQLDQRTIMKISEVYDVSVVTHPAYEQTSVDARSAEADRDNHREAAKKEAEDAAALIESQRRERDFQFLTLNHHYA